MDLRIEGEEIALGRGLFRAHVVQRDRAGAVLGSRDLAAQSCASLLRGATLVVALFIEPNQEDAEPPASASETAREAQREEPAEASPRVALPRERAEAPRVSTPPPPAPAAPLELSLGAGGAITTGLLPHVSGSVAAIARLAKRGSRWSFVWTGRYSWPQVLVRGTVRGEFAAVEQALTACVAFYDRASLHVDGCGGGVWWAIIPETSGVREDSEGWRPLAGPVASVVLELRRRSALGRLEAGAAFPLHRYAFYYEGSGGETKRFYSSGSLVVFVGLGGLFEIF